MIDGLVSAIGGLDYPRDRLQVIFALEADDLETLSAAALARLDCAVEIVIAPTDGPRTKPRACNAALNRARGEFVVIYDAEDKPDRRQLREAACRFALASPRLGCLQSPLRIAGARSLIERQFALEYAAQFEVALPAFARLRAPFPLGGTSNHFRRSVLLKIGGWDAYNVTEDADIGFRLAAAGYRSGVLRSPTWEEAPEGFHRWRPQRTRWMKGYMQTWGVQMRTPFKGGIGKLLALQLSVGLSIFSAFAHGPLTIVLTAVLLIQGLGGGATVGAGDMTLLLTGWATTTAVMAIGAIRAGFRPRLMDLAIAPLYWSLHCVAAACALLQLIRRPHHWHKTEHRPRRLRTALI